MSVLKLLSRMWVCLSSPDDHDDQSENADDDEDENKRDYEKESKRHQCPDNL